MESLITHPKTIKPSSLVRQDFRLCMGPEVVVNLAAVGALQVAGGAQRLGLEERTVSPEDFAKLRESSLDRPPSSVRLMSAEAGTSFPVPLGGRMMHTRG